MNCQILFSGKNMKNMINLSFAESAHSMVSVNGEIKKKKYLYLLLSAGEQR